MNPFINFNKRDIQLPKGCTDLADVKKCEYCDDVAIAPVGLPSGYLWCEACQRDLMEFVRDETPKTKLIDASDETASSKYLVEMNQRLAVFMREKAKERRHQ
jgi:hypothetical protein